MGPGVQAQSGGAAAAAVQVAVATALTLWVFDGRTLVKGSYLFELKPSRAKRKRPTRCRRMCYAEAGGKAAAFTCTLSETMRSVRLCGRAGRRARDAASNPSHPT